VTLGFLEKLTLRPDALSAQDAEAVLAAGVREEALIDAIPLRLANSRSLADSSWRLDREFAARAERASDPATPC
jgi:hypothetical protein